MFFSLGRASDFVPFKLASDVAASWTMIQRCDNQQLVPKCLATHHIRESFAHRITLEGLGEDAFAQSLSTARVDMILHQIDAPIFLLHWQQAAEPN